MNQNKEGQLPRSGPTTEIPGPYLSPEQTESFPLRSKPNSGKLGAFTSCCFWPCCQNLKPGGANNSSGLRPVIACFFTFSLALTVALVLQIRLGEPQVIPHGSVASDSRECSQIGASILRKGGNAVDAAVATTICLGVVLPHLTGIGGGGFIAIYDHRHRRVVDVIDFREQSPLEVNPGAQDSSNATKGSTLSGGHSVGIPGFLKGLGLAHGLHGRLPWSELIKPSINLCRSGFLVPSTLITARDQLPTSIYQNLKIANSSFWEHFGSLEAGHDMNDFEMASTLQAVAEEGPNALYNGSLTADFIATVAAAGGSITRTDLMSYKPIRRSLIRVPFGPSSWVYSVGSPSGGPLLLSALQLIDSIYQQSAYQLNPEQDLAVNDSTVQTMMNISQPDMLKNSTPYTSKEPAMPHTSYNLTSQEIEEKAAIGNASDGESSTESAVSGVTEDLGSRAVDSSKNPIFLSTQSQGSKEAHLPTFQRFTEKGTGVMGKATVVPYKLKNRKRRRSVDSSGDEGKKTLKQTLRESGEENDDEVMSILETLKDASLLHSLLGDPSYSRCSSDDLGTATNPMEKLKMLRKRITTSDEEVLLQSSPELLRPAGSNVAVVDANELYVSVVSGLSKWFGSQILTSRGYLLNSALASFFHQDESHLVSQPLSPGALSYQAPLPTSAFPSLKSKMAATPNHKASQSLRGDRLTKRSAALGANSVTSCNEYAGGKRPLSSSVVAFVVPRREDGVEQADAGSEGSVGACGQRIVLGSADAHSVAQVLGRMILKGSSLVEGIEYTRVKPLASSKTYGVEVGPESNKWGDDVVKASASLKGTPLPQPYASVNGIEEVGDILASHSDSRGGGVAARF